MRGPAVFLDRDGVINRATVRDGTPHPPASLSEVEILPGVAQALRRIKEAGFSLIIVTNQPDVARGHQSRDVVEAINAQLHAVLPIDEFRVCYHDDADDCACRKPRPGLLMQPPVYDLSASVMVGDRWRDIEAGRRAGVRATVLIEHGYEERIMTDPDLRVPSLESAADWIVRLLQPEGK